MINKNKLTELFSEIGVRLFNAELYVESNVEVEFNSLDELIEFAKLSNIKVAFYSFEMETEEIIDEELLEEHSLSEEALKIIQNDISDYNKAVKELNFDEPVDITIGFFLDNIYYYYEEQEDVYERNGLERPEDQLITILDEKDSELLKIWVEEKKREELERKDEEEIRDNIFHQLMEEILSDEEFSQCTNVDSRRMYIQIFMRKKNLSDSFFFKYGATPLQFINYVWNMYKFRKKNGG